MDKDEKIPISRESRAGIYLSQSQLTKHNRRELQRLINMFSQVLANTSGQHSSQNIILKQGLHAQWTFCPSHFPFL